MAVVARRHVILAAAACAVAARLVLGAQAPAGRARDLYDRALDLDRRGNAAAALSLLWEAAGLAPDDGEIQNHLGEALDRIGALDAAVNAFRAAAEARPPAPTAAKNLVLALGKAGRSDEAVTRARSWLADQPGDADRWFTLGLAQAEVDIDGAVDSLRRAIALDPRHALARYNLALILARADRFSGALDELQRALALQARPEIQYTLATVYWRLGRLDQAVTALEQAVAANPAHADAYLALGTIYKTRGDLARATRSLQRASELRPDLAAPHVVLAQTFTATGDTVAARRESSEADRLRTLTQQSREAATWTAVGAQKFDAGATADAAACFRRAIQAFDAFAPAHYQLGRALDRLGQHDAARAAFARAQQLNPALVPPR